MKNFKMREFLSNYCLRREYTRAQWWQEVARGFLLLWITGFLFYDSIWAGLLLTPYLVIHLHRGGLRRREERLFRIRAQFRDGMLAISSALSVGYSVENAFHEATGELITLYGEQGSVVEEFKLLENRLQVNEKVEDAMFSMAERVDIEEAKYFADVFYYAKRSGGNLVEIIGKTASQLSDKMEVAEEIEVMISGKKMEQRIMNFMPFAIIGYLRFSSYEFIAPLYGSLFGWIVMSVCLVVYVLAGMLADRIVRIEM
ncbi:MAG: hypothetical protein K6C69_05725 [Lachnospiraceae bacterium]|nr:hypothetical protein [Lachnospiraceae bacterium]